MGKWRYGFIYSLPPQDKELTSVSRTGPFNPREESQYPMSRRAAVDPVERKIICALA
jgi:hypothetical protein